MTIVTLLAAPSLLAIALVLTEPVSAPPAEGRFEHRTVRVKGESRRYAVWLPPGFSKHAKRWPAIVFLHGLGECGADGEKPLRVGLGPALAAHPERWPFVVVFPQKPREDEEWEEREALVFAVLARAGREFAIDGKRVALAGVSQGGHGAWTIAARNPGRFRALVPVCGYGRARTVAPRVANLPVWAFHGLRDDLVDPEETRQITDGIRDLKRSAGLDTTTVRVTLYPDANHNSWDPAFAEEALPRWLGEQLR